MGLSAGYISVLVLSLYVNSDAVNQTYGEPLLLWLLVPVLLFWVSWIWGKANRLEMNDDPVLFALRDTVSQTVSILVVLIVLMSSLGLSW